MAAFCGSAVAPQQVGPQLPDQEPKLHPLHCKLDFEPLGHQGGPNILTSDTLSLFNSSAALHSTVWDLNSMAGMESVTPALEAWRLNHWPAREVPLSLL